jgi:hypothetical protein
METLQENGIHIDNFKVEKQENIKLFLLTHGHKDHTKSDLKRFKPLVYCSYLTSLMIKHPNTIFLVANQWYTVEGIEFFVFDTIHCPGSYGYFFKKWNILHLGDSRVTPGLLQLFKTLHPKYILFDNTHEHYRGMFPPIESSAMMLNQLVTEMIENKKTVNVCIPHIGAILLLKLINMKVKLDYDSLKPNVIIMLTALKLTDEKSKVIVVGMKSESIDIMPSSQFFVVKKLDPNQVVHDHEKGGHAMTRIFASFHAGFMETRMLSEYKLISLNYDSD